MKRTHKLLWMVWGILLGSSSFAQHSPTYRLSGIVTDKATQELLPGVTILVENKGTGTVTDESGAYQLTLPPGTYNLTFSFISYQPQQYTIALKSDTAWAVGLSPSYIMTEEVVIRGAKDNENTQKTIDNVKISGEKLNEIPYLMGEVDPVKAVQLLPGVQTAGDGNTGFYVRGGGSDQNLVLLDDATVYNASHLFGFFSVFNGSTIDQVELIKGGMPAQYGGRLSSVLNIDTKSGNKQAFKGSGGLGLVAANLKLEVPLVKNKSALMIAGRRTYYDLVSKPLAENVSFLKTGLDYYFHDFNVKLDYLISDRDKLEVSGLMGKDHFQYDRLDFSNQVAWSNRTASLRWSHVFSSRLFSKTSLTLSDYRMNFDAGISSYHFQLTSNVQEAGLKHVMTYSLTQDHELTAGIQYTRHWFSPNNITAQAEETELNFSQAEQLHTRTGALFLNDQFTLYERWKLNAGVRLNHFQHVGPFQRYTVASPGVIADTVRYRAGKPAAQYMHLEPRFSLAYLINDASSLKVSYDRVYQYAHMAPMASTTLPTDAWVPSSKKIKPQQGTQYALSYFSSVNDYAYEGSVTFYYKDMRNQIEQRDGILVSYNQGANFDDDFLFGRGRSYGSELFVKKNKGHWTGWLSYTLSKTTRSFTEINAGAPYPSKYDRLHDLSLLLNYRRHPRWSFSGVFVFSSGNTMTLPVARYIIQGNIVNEYDGRNNFRMPAYHRLDLSATYTPAQTTRYRSSWVFSIYNVYSRLNPYYLYFDVQGDVKKSYLEVKAKQVSLFPIIPSVTYRFSF